MKKTLLIILRELRAHLVTKTAIIATLVLAVIALAVGGGVRWFASNGTFDDTTTVALTPATAPMRAAFAQVSSQPGVPEFELVETASAEEATQMVREGEADIALTSEDGHATLVADEDPGPTTELVVRQVTASSALIDYVTSLGGSPSGLAEAMSTDQLQVTYLSDDSDSSDASPAELFATAGIALIMLIWVMSASGIAAGVTEEKSSRVIEILLSTVRPLQIISAKIIGIGLAATIQLLVLAAAIVGGAYISGYGDALFSQVNLTSPWPVLFGIVGFLTYGCLYAGLGSLASRTEDLSATMSPVLMVAVASFYIPYMGVLLWYDKPILEIASFIPLVSPMCAPVAFALGRLSTPETLLAFAVNLVALAALAWLCAHIYKRGILHFGARMSLREVWKSRG